MVLLNKNKSAGFSVNISIFKITLLFNKSFILLKNDNYYVFIKLKNFIKFKLSRKTKLLTAFFDNSVTSGISSKVLKLYSSLFLVLLKNNIKLLKVKAKKKLRVAGTGFKVVNLKYSESINLLCFKLGYCHQIFVIIPKGLVVKCTKKNKLLISGCCYNSVNLFSTLIKSCRTPDSYKGKGVLYDNEILKLKTGKTL